MGNGLFTTAYIENFFGGWAVHDGDVNPVSIVDVTYDTPMIFGPLSFGLSELPAEPNVTFSLNAGTPAGGGASYGLGNVLSANVIFGDAIGTNLTAFAMEVLANGSIDTLSYTFSPFDTLSATDVNIVMNSPLFISGTDNANDDEPFSYTYANSVETITPVPGPGDLIVDGADFLKWQREDGTPASLLEWEANYGNDNALAAVTAGTAAVPEPGSVLLLAVAAGFLPMSRRR
jgi:hypothetical protein